MDDDKFSALQLAIAGIQKDIETLKQSIVDQGQQLGKYFDLLTNQTILSTKVMSIEESIKAEKVCNDRSHEKIYELLRQQTTPMQPAQPEKKDKAMDIIWDVVKILVGTFIGLLIAGKIKI